MLAITALLTTVVLETVRASASNGIRIEQAVRQATQDYLDVAVIRRAVEGSRSDYAESDTRFRGNVNEFSSLTASPIVSPTPSLQPYSLELVNDSSGVSLIYEDVSGSYVARYWPGGQARFSYYGGPSNLSHREVLGANLFEIQKYQWFDQWPPQSTTNRLGRYFLSLPIAVKITVQSNAGSDVLLFYLPSNAGPPARLEDVL